MFTRDGQELFEGMKVFCRWPFEKQYEFRYTEEHGKYNLEWESKLGRKCRKAELPKDMFSTKKALLEQYPELEKLV